MNIKKALGARIKELRRKAKLTQEQLAEAVNLQPRHISRVENGINTPSIEALEKIAIYLNVEMKELYNFQHLYPRDFLYQDILNIIDNLNDDEIAVTHKLLHSLFR